MKYAGWLSVSAISALGLFAASGCGSGDDLCSAIECSGHGTCATDNGVAYCLCEDEYANVGLECIPDTCKALGCVSGGCVADNPPYCACQPGFTGAKCDRCQDGLENVDGRCIKAGSCTPNPCAHGVCGFVSGVPTCTCDPGYAGDWCTACAANFHEETSGGKKVCVPDGPHDPCVPSPCADNYCGANSTGCACANNAGVAKITCTCTTGWAGESCTRCADGYKTDPATGNCVQKDLCENVSCADWKPCNPTTGKCEVAPGRCESSTDCTSPQTCDVGTNRCVADLCTSVNCHEGVCTTFNGAATCNCNYGFKPVAGPDCQTDPNANVPERWCAVVSPDTDPSVAVGVAAPTVIGQLWVSGQTQTATANANHRVQLGVTTQAPTYPIIASNYTWTNATFNKQEGNDHQYKADLTTTTAGTYYFIFRLSVDSGQTWTYCETRRTGDPASKGIIKSSPVDPGILTVTGGGGGGTIEDFCADPNVDCGLGRDCMQVAREVGDFIFCEDPGNDGYTLDIRYIGDGEIDLANSETRLNGADVDLSADFDETTQTFSISATGLAPSKYTYLLRLKNKAGTNVEPLFVPMWVGSGDRYRDFQWHDGTFYQVMTDRFKDGNPSNNLSNPTGIDPDSTWQGGDHAGILQEIKQCYFNDMGINALWISSPILNSHNRQPPTAQGGEEKYMSYHSYHPIATGYTNLNHYGYDNPLETAFGTAAELHELVNEAHKRGIRVVTDFVTNHVQIEANIYAQHHDWFWNYVACDPNHWDDEYRTKCWFTEKTPDVNYSQAAVRQAVVDHAIWMIQEFNLDGFRVDALKHMDDSFARALKSAIVEKVETTVNNHDMTEEPTVFYMVGESLGGWARYHVRADMVQGQVDEGYYQKVMGVLLKYEGKMSDLAGFAISNDTAYLSPGSCMGGTGGYSGAIMGNFFANHDQIRALTEAMSNWDNNLKTCVANGTSLADAQKRLRLAQAFLMTSPRNVAMLYQGDDIGTEGCKDPKNRKMQKFTGLSADEQASLDNIRKIGRLREKYRPLRRGTRSTVVNDLYFTVYKLSMTGEDDVYVAINRDANKTWSPPAGYADGVGNCSGGSVPSQTACIFVKGPGVPSPTCTPQ